MLGEGRNWASGLHLVKHFWLASVLMLWVSSSLHDLCDRCRTTTQVWHCVWCTIQYTPGKPDSQRIAEWSRLMVYVPEVHSSSHSALTSAFWVSGVEDVIVLDKAIVQILQGSTLNALRHMQSS